MVSQNKLKTGNFHTKEAQNFGLALGDANDARSELRNRRKPFNFLIICLKKLYKLSMISMIFTCDRCLFRSSALDTQTRFLFRMLHKNESLQKIRKPKDLLNRKNKFFIFHILNPDVMKKS